MNNDLFETMHNDHYYQHRLTATGNEEDWGAGESTDEQLPPAPANVNASIVPVDVAATVRLFVASISESAMP